MPYVKWLGVSSEKKGHKIEAEVSPFYAARPVKILMQPPEGNTSAARSMDKGKLYPGSMRCMPRKPIDQVR